MASVMQKNIHLITRNNLYERKKINSFILNEFEKSIIVNSVSSSNVTSHEAAYVKVTNNNDETRTITPDYKGPKYTIEPNDVLDSRLLSIPHTLHRPEVNYENLFDVDVSSVSSTNPTTPRGTSYSATATKRRSQ